MTSRNHGVELSTVNFPLPLRLRTSDPDSGPKGSGMWYGKERVAEGWQNVMRHIARPDPAPQLFFHTKSPQARVAPIGDETPRTFRSATAKLSLWHGERHSQPCFGPCRSAGAAARLAKLPFVWTNRLIFPSPCDPKPSSGHGSLCRPCCPSSPGHPIRVPGPCANRSSRPRPQGVRVYR
jgi:hypothetical protein